MMIKPLTFTILRLLGDGEFHSGAGMARRLGVSRATICTALQRLEEAGLAVNRIHGRGYRLPQPVQWLDRDAILHHASHAAGKVHRIRNLDLQIRDITESTNRLLLQDITTLAGTDNPVIPVVAAELQTHGRGRRGRQWHSGISDSLTFSMLWRFQYGASSLSGLSLVVGVAIIRVLRARGVTDATLKWPNDILCHYLKLAGILIELQGEVLGPAVAVIGIGINLNLSKQIRSHIDQGVTDMLAATGHMPDRNHLLGQLIAELVIVLEEFEEKGFTAFREEWVQYHGYEGKPVILYLPDGSTQTGTVRGVADDGALLLQTPVGMSRHNSGEISLREIASHVLPAGC